MINLALDELCTFGLQAIETWANTGMNIKGLDDGDTTYQHLYLVLHVETVISRLGIRPSREQMLLDLSQSNITVI